MRVLTLNLWHGLAPEGPSNFVALESGYRRRRREQLQVEALSRVEADLLLLQEVNPLNRRNQVLSQALGATAFGQHDLVGLKLSGFGWPWNLNSGLSIFAKSKYGPRLVKGLKLSGAKWSKERNWLSLQWSESRYAVLIEMLHPAFGRVLVVNCHLHHGLEMDENLRRQIDQMSENELLTSNATHELKERLEQTNLRREREITTLLDYLSGVRERYSLVMLGGDFNFTPDSVAYGHVRQFGFEDLWRNTHGEQDGFTFDHELNASSHVFTQRFPLAVESEDLSFSPKVRQSLLELLQAQERRRRRIDFLFAMTNGPRFQIKSIDLFGVPEGDDVALSDHFGLLADLEGD